MVEVPNMIYSLNNMNELNNQTVLDLVEVLMGGLKPNRAIYIYNNQGYTNIQENAHKSNIKDST